MSNQPTTAQTKRAQVIRTTVADCQLACFRATDLTMLREALRQEQAEQNRKGITNAINRRINQLTSLAKS